MGRDSKQTLLLLLRLVGREWRERRGSTGSGDIPASLDLLDDAGELAPNERRDLACRARLFVRRTRARGSRQRRGRGRGRRSRSVASSVRVSSLHRDPSRLKSFAGRPGRRSLENSRAKNRRGSRRGRHSSGVLIQEASGGLGSSEGGNSGRFDDGEGRKRRLGSSEVESGHGGRRGARIRSV
jgi:hypothetical protein